MGNVKSIPPGDVQRMSAGSGVMHSEFNFAQDQTTHFLQIWILPKFRGVTPSYEQRTINAREKRGRLRLIASPDGAQDSVHINADARIHAGLFDGAETGELALDPARKAYVHVALGTLQVNGRQLEAGDALLLEGENRISVAGGRNAEVLVFDLAA
jgi:redox-sensitive bicupin YhaK (pirin superfamily)